MTIHIDKPIFNAPTSEPIFKPSLALEPPLREPPHPEPPRSRTSTGPEGRYAVDASHWRHNIMYQLNFARFLRNKYILISQYESKIVYSMSNTNKYAILPENSCCVILGYVILILFTVYLFFHRLWYILIAFLC